MSPPSIQSASSSRDLTLMVENESGSPEEYFAQVGLSLGRAKSNTIHIDHPDVDRIHAKVVKRGEAYWLKCEAQATIEVLFPEPGHLGEVELAAGLTLLLGGVTLRCRRPFKGMGALSDDYWAEAAGGERFRVETEAFTGELPRKIGPYEIRKFVARGGMGIVLRGIHEETDQPAAVKLPTPDLNRDQQWLRRFEQEVRTLKSVTHPNLVRLQDAGQQGDLHWMAMDWVQGSTVSERLAKCAAAGESMPFAEIQLTLRQVVEGLGALHARGIVHRDLKPSNLLVSEDGGVKVADFGLAKQVGGDQSTLLTRTGTLAGTMQYMAPEQAEGLVVTSATDIYALGVIWHELLTGKRPGRRLKIQTQRPGSPRRWESLIEQCLDDDPSDRPTLDKIKQAIDAESFAAAAAAVSEQKAVSQEQDEAGTGSTRAPRVDSGAPPKSSGGNSQVQALGEAPKAARGGACAPQTKPEPKKTGGKFKWVAAAAVLIIAAIIFASSGKNSLSQRERAGERENASANQKPPAKPVPAKPTQAKSVPAKPFVNTLGMAFVPVPVPDVQFSIWETRVKDYAAYAAANAGVDDDWKSPTVFGTSIPQTDTHPVVNVSWEDATAFCAWLTRKELASGNLKAGQRYRLPSDEEWSLAVGLANERGSTPEAKDGGVKDVYPWGRQWPPPKGAGNYDERLNVDNYEYMAPVGSFAANNRGIYDLGGNVWEWCEDKWNPTSSHRVLRGGSWGILTPGILLSSIRYIGTPDFRLINVGFRCVMDGSGR